MLVINDADVRRKFYWKKAPMTDQIDQSFPWLWKCIFASWIWISKKLNFMPNLHLLNIKVTKNIHMVCNIHVYNCRYACTYVPLQDCSYCWFFIQGWCKHFGVFHFQITQNCIINDITSECIQIIQNICGSFNDFSDGDQYNKWKNFFTFLDGYYD